MAFDLYFIGEDIHELTDKDSPVPDFLKITHLILDVDITILTLVESAVPEAAPVVGPLIIALAVVRIGINDFYLDISEELSKVKGKDVGTKMVAFFKGVGEGLGDFLTLGLGRQLRQLRAQRMHDMELLRNLSNPVNYFNVTFQGLDEDGSEVGMIDFTAGTLSQFGGFLTVKLNENGSFTVELPQVSSNSETPTQVQQTFSFSHPVNDIVLGIGQVAHPQYIQQEAKLWLLINVETFESFDTHQSSQYGTYFGNSEDNNFYSVQGSNGRKKRSIVPERRATPLIQKLMKKQVNDGCQSTTNSFTIQLQNYHYDLYGRGGDDHFFLGPQSSRVTGGDDNDFYHIPANGGKAIINNFAQDEEMDTLFLNVSYSDIFCMWERKIRSHCWLLSKSCC